MSPPTKKTQTYEEYWDILQTTLEYLEQDLGLLAADEIICGVINDCRRKVLIRDDFDKTNTIH